MMLASGDIDELIAQRPPVRGGPLVAELGKRRAFVERDVPGLATFDLVLRRFRGRMVSVAFDLEIACMYASDRTADPSGFGVPTHAITDVEFVHGGVSARF